MSRLTRTRTRAALVFNGTAKFGKNGTVTSTTASTRTLPASFIQDSYGRPVVPSPLNLSSWEGTFPRINGFVKPKVTTLFDRADYENFTVQALPTAMSSMTTLPIPSGWQLDLVAGTNPSRPLVTIPELIEDLVDLPKQIKGLGDILVNTRKRLGTPKGLAGEYLGVQFGWRPLIDDLEKLLNLQSYVIKRNKELNQLYSGKGLRRRLKFVDDTVTTAIVSTTSVSTSVITHACSLSIKRDTWGTIRWRPTTPPPYHPDDASQNAFTRRLLIGATPEGLAKGLWAVIPWTWLIGWFTNFGKYTLAHSWSVPAQYENMCFMSRAVATYESGGVGATNTVDDKLVADGKLIRSLKTRVVSNTVTVGFNMPYLDMFRLSIAGALFTQRFAGKSISVF